MASKEVVIESMWSPAVALLVAQGVPCRYAFPPSGYPRLVQRPGIPTHVTGDKLQAVYDYLNWMYEGYLGALIMRQGYYVANGKTLPAWIKSTARQTGKPPFTTDEYDFWYNGKPAAKDLPGHHRPGRRRQEGAGARRRLVPPALCKYYRLELVLRGERVPGQAVQRLPQRLAPEWRSRNRRQLTAEGAAAAAPSAIEGAGLDLIGADEGLPGRHARRRRRQPARRPRRVRRPARPVRAAARRPRCG